MSIFPSLAMPENATAIEPNEQLKRLLLAQLPQVTVRGFDSGGFFDSLANDLPEPAMLDDTSERARELERLLKQATSISVSKSITTPEPTVAAMSTPTSPPAC